MPRDDGRGKITLWVEVPVSAHEAAEAFAKCYADEGAEELCAALLLDLAALRAGRRALRLSWVLGWLVCEGWPRVAVGAGAAGKEGGNDGTL